MSKALLDTDILSEIAKGIDRTVARHANDYRKSYAYFTISAISIMEVIQGYQRIGAVRRIQSFRAAIVSEEILPFDQGASDLAGQIAGDLDRIGRPIGRCDPMIAAVAIVNRLELVTGNMNHYQRIQQLGYPLTLSNWRL